MKIPHKFEPGRRWFSPKTAGTRLFWRILRRNEVWNVKQASPAVDDVIRSNLGLTDRSSRSEITEFKPPFCHCTVTFGDPAVIWPRSIASDESTQPLALHLCSLNSFCHSLATSLTSSSPPTQSWSSFLPKLLPKPTQIPTEWWYLPVQWWHLFIKIWSEVAEGYEFKLTFCHCPVTILLLWTMTMQTWGAGVRMIVAATSRKMWTILILNFQCRDVKFTKFFVKVSVFP